MIKLNNRITRRLHPEKPLAVCELVKHPNGAFNINETMFRPEWPIGPDNELYEQAREIIQLGFDAANKVYNGREGFPRRIRVEIYENSRRVIIQE